MTPAHWWEEVFNKVVWPALVAVNVIDMTILTHQDRVTHICVSKLTIIGSDDVLSPGRRHRYDNLMIQQIHLKNPTMHWTNIPQCTILWQKCAPCTHFCYKMVHYGILEWCIVVFMQQIYRGRLRIKFIDELGLFSCFTQNSHIWQLPCHVNTSMEKGTLNQLTMDPTLN